MFLLILPQKITHRISSPLEISTAINQILTNIKPARYSKGQIGICRYNTYVFIFSEQQIYSYNWCCRILFHLYVNYTYINFSFQIPKGCHTSCVSSVFVCTSFTIICLNLYNLIS